MASTPNPRSKLTLAGFILAAVAGEGREAALERLLCLLTPEQLSVSRISHKVVSAKDSLGMKIVKKEMIKIQINLPGIKK
jgi:hypothetical protein